MRIAITGASGNVGSALLRQLSRDSLSRDSLSRDSVFRDGEVGRAGHQMVGIARRRPPSVPPYDRADWVVADLSQDGSIETLTRAFDGADVVVHLAWLIQPSYDRQLLLETNQGGTRRVIEAVRRAGVGHLVHASSVGVYSPRRHRSPVTEDWPRDGVETSSYSVDKAAAERLLDEAESFVRISRIRPGLILQGAAASEISRYFLPRWLPPSLVRTGPLRYAPYPAEFSLQFVHANDVARAFVSVIEQRAPGAFNVVADPIIDRDTWRAIFGGIGPAPKLGLLRRAAELSWKAHLQPTDPGWVDLAASVPVLSSARIRELGWSPAHRSDEALLEFVRGLNHKSGTRSPALAPR